MRYEDGIRLQQREAWRDCHATSRQDAVVMGRLSSPGGLVNKRDKIWWASLPSSRGLEPGHRRSKVTVSLDAGTLRRLDELVRRAVFPNRSRAVQSAVEEKLERLERGRLAHECAKLDPAFEKALAEEGLWEDLSRWPEY